MKKMVTGVLALVMVLVMVGCGQKDNGVVNGVAKDGATIGEGAKSFTMEVVDKDGGKGCTSRPSTASRWTMTPTGCTGPSISMANMPRLAWMPPV